MKRLRFSPWLVALLAAHLLLGSGNGLWLALACVTLHEMGHVAAARRAFGDWKGSPPDGRRQWRWRARQ